MGHETLPLLSNPRDIGRLFFFTETEQSSMARALAVDLGSKEMLTNRDAPHADPDFAIQPLLHL